MGPRHGAAEAGAAQTPPKTLAFAGAPVAAPRRRALPGGQRRTADEPSVVPARATGRCSASETEDVPLRVAARPDLEVAGRLKRDKRLGTPFARGPQDGLIQRQEVDRGARGGGKGRVSV